MYIKNKINDGELSTITIITPIGIIIPPTKDSIVGITKNAAKIDGNINIIGIISPINSFLVLDKNICNTIIKTMASVNKVKLIFKPPLTYNFKL